MISLNIGEEVITPIIEQQVIAMMTTLLGGKDKIVDKIIKQILEEKVDDTGRPSSYGKKTFFEWLLLGEITKLIKELIKDEAKLKVDFLRDSIKKQIQTEKGSTTIADALLNGLNETFKDNWTPILKIELVKNE